MCCQPPQLQGQVLQLHPAWLLAELGLALAFISPLPLSRTISSQMRFLRWILATIPVGQAITFNYFISCGSLLGLQLGAVPTPRSGAASALWTGWTTWQLLKMKGLIFFSILNMIQMAYQNIQMGLGEVHTSGEVALAAFGVFAKFLPLVLVATTSSCRAGEYQATFLGQGQGFALSGSSTAASLCLLYRIRLCSHNKQGALGVCLSRAAHWGPQSLQPPPFCPGCV